MDRYGLCTRTSKNGIINCKAVKSKPNDIQIFGYTKEIGEGEKSPDNPYELVSLDSGKGNNLYNIDGVYKYIINPETGIMRYGMILDAPNSGYYTIKGFNDTRMISYRIYNTINNTVSDYVTTWQWHDFVVPVSQDEKLYLYYGTDFPDLSSIKKVSKNAPVVIDGKTIQKYEPYFEHSIILSNNNTTIQVPVPIALKSVEGVSDYIFKDTDGIWKLMQNCQKYEFSGNEKFGVYQNIFFTDNTITGYQANNCVVCNSNFYTAIKNQTTAFAMTTQINNSICFRVEPYNTIYIKSVNFATKDSLTSWLVEQYTMGTPLIIIYQLKTPIVHTLSDYAQGLLNSFVLEKDNIISVTDNTEFKIKGWIK